LSCHAAIGIHVADFLIAILQDVSGLLDERLHVLDQLVLVAIAFFFLFFFCDALMVLLVCCETR
jgi:hypothetical protein